MMEEYCWQAWLDCHAKGNFTITRAKESMTTDGYQTLWGRILLAGMVMMPCPKEILQSLESDCWFLFPSRKQNAGENLPNSINLLKNEFRVWIHRVPQVYCNELVNTWLLIFYFFPTSKRRHDWISNLSKFL